MTVVVWHLEVVRASAKGAHFCLVLIPVNPPIAPRAPSQTPMTSPVHIPPGASQSSRQPSRQTSILNSILCVGSPSRAFGHSQTVSSVLQWAHHSTLVETSLISPQFARFSASSTIPPRPFVNHDQHTIPALKFSSHHLLPRLSPSHHHASLSFGMSPSALSAKQPSAKTRTGTLAKAFHAGEFCRNAPLEVRSVSKAGHHDDKRISEKGKEGEMARKRGGHSRGHKKRHNQRRSGGE